MLSCSSGYSKCSITVQHWRLYYQKMRGYTNTIQISIHIKYTPKIYAKNIRQIYTQKIVFFCNNYKQKTKLWCQTILYTCLFHTMYNNLTNISKTTTNHIPAIPYHFSTVKQKTFTYLLHIL